jgi:hypothetical protein
MRSLLVTIITVLYPYIVVLHIRGYHILAALLNVTLPLASWCWLDHKALVKLLFWIFHVLHEFHSFLSPKG